MLYIASSDNPDCHHGKVYAIDPIPGVERLSALAPSDKLLRLWEDWKKHAPTKWAWQKFEAAYSAELATTKARSAIRWVLGEALTQDITLVVAPPDTIFDYKHTLHKTLARSFYSSFSWGGLDVPVSKIEKLERQAKEMGIPVIVTKIYTSVKGYFYYRISVKGVYRQLTKADAERVLGKLINTATQYSHKPLASKLTSGN